MLLGRSPGLLLFLTLCASAEYAMAVVKRLEPVSTGDLLLHSFDLFAVELDQGAALSADQVIVMAVLIVMLIQCPAIVGLKLSGQTAFFQEFQRAVYRRESDCGVFCSHESVEIFARDMTFGIEKNVQNCVPLSGALQAGPLEVLVKNLGFFSLFRH